MRPGYLFYLMQFFFEPGSMGASRVREGLIKRSKKFPSPRSGTREVRVSMSADPALLVIWLSIKIQTMMSGKIGSYLLVLHVFVIVEYSTE